MANLNTLEFFPTKFKQTQVQVSFKSDVNTRDARFTDHRCNEDITQTSGRSELHFLVGSSVIYRLARTNRCSKAGRVTRAHPIGACVSRGNVARQRWRLVPICWTSDVFFSVTSGARKVVGGRVGPFRARLLSPEARQDVRETPASSELCRKSNCRSQFRCSEQENWTFATSARSGG